MWSVAVLLPALPGRRVTQAVPGAVWSVIHERPQRVKPEARLNVGAACSLSERAVTMMASTSTTNGRRSLTLTLGVLPRPAVMAPGNLG
jgi:hypothetical protein